MCSKNTTDMIHTHKHKILYLFSVFQHRFRQYLSDYHKRTAKLRARSGYTPPAHAQPPSPAPRKEAITDLTTSATETTEVSCAAESAPKTNSACPPKGKVLRALPETRRLWDAHYTRCQCYMDSAERSLESWLAEAAGRSEPH